MLVRYLAQASALRRFCLLSRADIDHDGDVDPSGVGFCFDAVDLVVVAVDEGHPSTGVERVAPFCLVEDLSDHGGGGCLRRQLQLDADDPCGDHPHRRLHAIDPR